MESNVFQHRNYLGDVTDASKTSRLRLCRKYSRIPTTSSVQIIPNK